MIKIAIDGPSGAGKSSLAKGIAKQLGIIYIDTGALYRSVGLWVSRKGISTDDKEGIIASLEGIRVELGFDSEGDRKIRVKRIRHPRGQSAALRHAERHSREKQRSYGRP